MEFPKYITLEVEKIDGIIINAISQVYGSHIGYITEKLKNALIQNSELEIKKPPHIEAANQ